MAEGTSSSDRKKSPHHKKAVFPSQLLDCWHRLAGQKMEKQRRGEGGRGEISRTWWDLQERSGRKGFSMVLMAV